MKSDLAPSSSQMRRDASVFLIQPEAKLWIRNFSILTKYLFILCLEIHRVLSELSRNTLCGIRRRSSSLFST